MKKNDKLVVILGVIILILASIGIYYWVPGELKATSVEAEDFFNISGVLAEEPAAIEVSDECMFYPLIATPLAVNYDKDGNQNVKPLYVKNMDDPSDSIERAEDDIDIHINEIIKSGTPKEVSLSLAEKYWESSKGVLLIKDDQNGYNLGLLATPIASYLRIPIIVTNEIDDDVKEILYNLDVEYSLVCGDLEKFKNYKHFEDADDIINFSIELIEEKFGKIDYITLANPLDAKETEVLDSESYTLPSTRTAVGTASIIPSNLISMISPGPFADLGTFKIPNDYKYALVKMECINYGVEDVDDLGDRVMFTIGLNDEDANAGIQQWELLVGFTSGGIPERDENGKITKDILYSEMVLYDRNGEEYNVNALGQYVARKQGDVQVNVEIEKLSDPVYPRMKKLSTLAPYLTAYHKGLLIAKPEFAFVANDEDDIPGADSPGVYIAAKNPGLFDPINDHVLGIQKELNEILARLTHENISAEEDLSQLREYYEENPVYITLIGDPVVLPQYMHPHYLNTLDEDMSYYFGIGTPSDVIYGNIDPDPSQYGKTVQATDLFTYYPYQENVVGRIVGWDVQDTSAQILRNIFYYNILDNLEKSEWDKDKALVMSGCGTDFQKPPVISRIAEVLKIFLGGEDAVKWPTGYTEFSTEYLKRVLDDHFETEKTLYTESQIAGFSNEALNKIKRAGILNRLLFPKWQLKLFSGEEKVRGGELVQESNFIWMNGHGNFDILEHGDVLLAGMGAGLGIGNQIVSRLTNMIDTGLEYRGAYTTRSVEQISMGPSVLTLESCVCGRVDFPYPEVNIGQAFLHAGTATLIAASTETALPGGYLEPKNRIREFGIPAYLKTSKLAEETDEFMTDHFGVLIAKDFYMSLFDDSTVGMALRDARNDYLPQDANSTFLWTPPLSTTTGSLSLDQSLLKDRVPAAFKEDDVDRRNLDHKYTAYYEYAIYGDPAFNPYVPAE